mgnify:CR=1 FL=1
MKIKTILFLIGIRKEVHGSIPNDNNTSYIICPNHSSYLDIFLLPSMLPQHPFSFLGKAEILKYPIVRTYFKSLNIPVYRKDKSRAGQALVQAQKAMQDGWSIVIFPEGTRSTSRKMSRFKHGVSLLALDRKVPVVPVYLTGLAKLRPKGTREIFPGPASANIQPPIYFEEGTSVEDATRQIFDALNTVHQRVIEHGDEAGRWDWTPDQ